MKMYKDKLDELEDILINTAGIDWEYSHQLLQDYDSMCQVLKESGDNYPYDQSIRLYEIYNELETQLPNVSDNIYEQYVIYLNLLAICLEPIKK